MTGTKVGIVLWTEGQGIYRRGRGRRTGGGQISDSGHRDEDIRFQFQHLLHMESIRAENKVHSYQIRRNNVRGVRLENSSSSILAARRISKATYSPPIA